MFVLSSSKRLQFDWVRARNGIASTGLNSREEVSNSYVMFAASQRASVSANHGHVCLRSATHIQLPRPYCNKILSGLTWNVWMWPLARVSILDCPV